MGVHLPRAVIRRANKVKKQVKKARSHPFRIKLHPMPRAHDIIRDASKLYKAAMERKAKARRRLHKAILTATATGMKSDKDKVSTARAQWKKAVKDAMYDQAGLIAVTKHAKESAPKADAKGVFDGVEW